MCACSSYTTIRLELRDPGYVSVQFLKDFDICSEIVEFSHHAELRIIQKS